MKKLFYLIAIAGFIMVSCTKPNENPKQNDEKKYYFSISAERENDSDDTDQTRVETINGLMYWSVGDTVGMFIRGNNHPIYTMALGNLPMIGQHTEPVRSTTFTGYTNALGNLNGTYHNYRYFTYFPYSSTNNPKIVNGNLDIAIEVPQRFDIRKNEFPFKYALMCAGAENISPPTWLENGEQKWGERITFNYKHVFSYIRVKISGNRTGQPFYCGRITISFTYSDNTGVETYGTFYTNEYLNDLERRQGDKNQKRGDIIANINDTIDIGDEFYIPVVPLGLGWVTTRVRIYGEGTGGAASSKTIQPTNKKLERGKIYTVNIVI